MGCIRKVSEETWMNEYLSTLPKKILALVESTQSNLTYRFGDGKEAKAVQTIKTPVLIGNKNFIWKSMHLKMKYLY